MKDKRRAPGRCLGLDGLGGGGVLGDNLEGDDSLCDGLLRNLTLRRIRGSTCQPPLLQRVNFFLKFIIHHYKFIITQQQDGCVLE